MNDRQAKQGGSAETSQGPGTIFYVVLGLLVVAGIGWLWFLRGGGSAEPLGPLTADEVQAPADSGAMAAVMGAKDAPVTLVEFADYTCSHCARFASLPARALRNDYVETGDLRWILYDFPLRETSNAIPAALAARCAGAQERYWDMHDRLFARQGEWGGQESPSGSFEDYAEDLGLDLEAFRTCYSERRYVKEIMASRKYGRQLGVNATPTLFVGGERAADYRYETLKPMIEARLEEATAGARSSAGPAASGGGG